MGKMKRGRHKAHVAAVKVNKADPAAGAEESDRAAGTEEAEVVEVKDVQTPTTATQSRITLPDNMFTGVKIDLAQLQKGLPDFDVRSTITSKTLKGSNMTKLEKRKLKHEFLMKKVDAITAAKKADKARKKRRKTPVVGDMQGLVDSLPTLDLLLKDNPVDRAREREKAKNRVSKKPIPKTKTRQKRMLDDIAVFNQVIAHPAFKSNPQSTMKEHIKNWSDRQENMDKL